MFSIHVILLILAAHWIADFVLQSHNMAINKSKSNRWLSLHVMTYTAALYVIMLFMPIALLAGSIEQYISALAVWAAANGLLHWITDYVTSRINARLWAAGRVHDFFVCVGLDQLIHYICLFSTANMLLEM